MAELLNKEFKKDWWFKADFGQDYCWIVAENNNYPVRLFFEFEEGGWADMKRHYFDSYAYADEILASWHFAKYDIDYSFDLIRENIEKYFDKFEESKSNKKSMKEYRTVGFEQLIRDTTKEILEEGDIFDLGMCSEVIITYDNEGRARITSNGDVDMSYLTLPTYAFSSGYTPKNKKLEKLFDNIMESNMESARERLWDNNEDELIALGIEDKDDEKLNYNDLYEMGASDLAEELSEYEMDMEGTDLYTNIFCEITEVDEGFEFTVTMTVDDEYSHALVKDYKSNSVIFEENMDERDLRDTIESAIKEVTEQF